MNINRAILESALVEKFANKALTGIIAPIITNALPFDEDKVDSTLRRNVFNYTERALESLGGINTFITSIESETDIKKKKFGSDLLSICTNIAIEATGRISDGILADNTKTLGEIVDPAAFTKAEVESFIKSAESISPDKISNMVKDKTVKVVKAEQEAYDREDQLNQDLQDETSMDSLISGIGAEEYRNIILGKGGVTGHVSLFSRLQEESLANLMYAQESDLEDINFDKLYLTTMEQTLDIFKNYTKDPVMVLEHHLGGGMPMDCVSNEKKAKLVEMSTIFAIVMYTFFETCNTMGVCKPSMGDVSKFVNPENEFAKRMGVANELSKEDQIKKAVDSYAMYMRKPVSDPTPEGVHEAINQIQYFKNKISESPLVGVATETCLITLDDLSKSYEAILEKLNYVAEASNVEDGYYDKLRKDEDIASFGRVKFSMGRHPSIDTIRFTLANESDKSVLVQGVSTSNGNVIREMNINFNYPKVNSVYEYVKECLIVNNFSEVEKRKEFKYGSTGVKEYL